MFYIQILLEYTNIKKIFFNIIASDRISYSKNSGKCIKYLKTDNWGWFNLQVIIQLIIKHLFIVQVMNKT